MKSASASILFLASTLACATPPRGVAVGRSSASQHEPGSKDSWVSIVAQNVDPDGGAVAISDELGGAVEGGSYVTHAGSTRIGWEAMLMYSQHEAGWQDATYIYYEEPTNVAIGAGARAAISGFGGLFDVYVRLGLLYQYIYDDILDDAGPGAYTGVGFDVRLLDALSVGPQILYTTAALSDFDVDQLLVGVKLNFLF